MPGKYNEHLILASKSPRRQELIRLLFNNVGQISASDEEPRWRSGEHPKDYLQACIDAKWRSALSQADPISGGGGKASGLLVGDTIVVLGNDVLGKPDTPAEAKEMLGRLSGVEHEVWTGIRLGRRHGDKLRVRDSVVKSRVRFRPLAATEIERYVEIEKPFDKAGAYGFQDRALLFVQSVKGSYSNIVGLPVEEVRRVAGALKFV